MSARHDSVCNSTPLSEVDPTPFVRWLGRGSPGFESASIVTGHAYGDNVDSVSLVYADSGAFSLVDNDDDWNLGDMPLSRNASVHTSHCVDISIIHTRCHELNLAVFDKAGDLGWLAFQGPDALQTPGEARTRVAALKASKAKPLAKNSTR